MLRGTLAIQPLKLSPTNRSRLAQRPVLVFSVEAPFWTDLEEDCPCLHLIILAVLERLVFCRSFVKTDVQCSRTRRA